jgi:drug/metabolite transporter superfamily protein YnfA
MTKNMGSTDKTIRLFLAALFIVLFFTNVVSGMVGYVFLALGGIFVLTSLVSFCPLYALFGLSTCPVSERR